MEYEKLRNKLEKLITDRHPIRNPANLPIYLSYLLSAGFALYESISSFATQTNSTLEDYMPAVSFLAGGTIMHGFKEFLSYKLLLYKQKRNKRD